MYKLESLLRLLDFNTKQQVDSTLRLFSSIRLKLKKKKRHHNVLSYFRWCIFYLYVKAARKNANEPKRPTTKVSRKMDVVLPKQRCLYMNICTTQRKYYPSTLLFFFKCFFEHALSGTTTSTTRKLLIYHYSLWMSSIFHNVYHHNDNNNNRQHYL